MRNWCKPRKNRSNFWNANLWPHEN